MKKIVSLLVMLGFICALATAPIGCSEQKKATTTPPPAGTGDKGKTTPPAKP